MLALRFWGLIWIGLGFTYRSSSATSPDIMLNDASYMQHKPDQMNQYISSSEISVKSPYHSNHPQSHHHRRKQTFATFVEVFHPEACIYLSIKDDGSATHASQRYLNSTLFLMSRVAQSFILENVGTCRNLCIKQSGYVYTLPSSEGQSNADCHLNKLMHAQKGGNLAMRTSLISHAHQNQSHVLSLSFQEQFWRANWLKKSEVAPPSNMQLHLMLVTQSKAKSLQIRPVSSNKDNNNEYCEKVWKETDKLINRRHASKHHTDKNWQSTYKRAHNQCGLNKSCIFQVRKKCVQKGQRLLGSAFNQFTQCVFPLKMRNIFESSAPSGKCWKIRQKWGIKQCLRRKKKKCEKRVKARHPNVGNAKIKDKCKRVRKVEKCMVVIYKLSKRLRKPWNKKLARKRCKSKFLTIM